MGAQETSSYVAQIVSGDQAAVPAAVPVTPKTVDVNGTRVTYHVQGERNLDHDPVVLIHGTSGTTQGHFGFLFPMLAVRHKVISPDFALPVDLAGNLTLEHMEEQVLAVLADAAPGQKVTLVGYSLGAAIAAFIAARHPERISNLVLLAGWIKTDTQQFLFNHVWRTLRDLDDPAINEFTIFGAFGAPFLATKTLAEMARGAMPLDRLVDLQMDLNLRVDLTDLVPAIKARTLVIACTYDQMVPRHHSKALFGAIEDARYSEVAAGHAVVFERPAEVFRLIDNFAARPDAYPAGSIIPAVKP